MASKKWLLDILPPNSWKILPPLCFWGLAFCTGAHFFMGPLGLDVLAHMGGEKITEFFGGTLLDGLGFDFAEAAHGAGCSHGVGEAAAHVGCEHGAEEVVKHVGCEHGAEFAHAACGHGEDAFFCNHTWGTDMPVAPGQEAGVYNWDAHDPEAHADCGHDHGLVEPEVNKVIEETQNLPVQAL